MEFSVSVDATKVVRGVGICTSFNLIVGYVSPQHYISLDGKRYDDTNNITQEVKKYEFDKANKMKIAIIFLHAIAKVHIPYIVVCG